MNKFGFVLGRETALSVAEISAVLSRKNIKWETDFFQSPIFIISAAEKIEIKVEELGGTVKTFEIVSETSDILGEIKKWELKQKEKRINFGLSYYGIKPVKYLGQELKNYYLEKGLKARNVIGRMGALSSVIVHENKLIERGFEALIIKAGNKFIIGRTLEVQDYKAYSFRDFGRPFRDDRSGMLPPKLAKIMVNLAGKNPDAEIYDPFCGSGTILSEAYVLGYKNLFGSDISDRAVSDTKANLNWLEQNGSSKPKEIKIFRNDVLEPHILAKYDAIICEGYLGQPVIRDRQRALYDSAELNFFYARALKNLHKMLKPKGVVVIAIPFFIVGKEKIYLSIVRKLNEFGFTLSYPELPKGLLNQKTLTYFRPDQRVGREILVLKSK